MTNSHNWEHGVYASLARLQFESYVFIEKTIE